MADTKTMPTLESLLETVENGRKGFAQAAEKLDEDGNTTLAAEMREMSQQRLKMANELRALAAAEGSPIEDKHDGTVPGALHRSWMALKDALTGDDPHAVLAAAEEGEDHAVADYESALEEDLPESVKSLLQRQYGEIKTAHDRVRDLRDANS